MGKPGRKLRWGNENSGKREVSICSYHPDTEEARQSRQDMIASPKKVPSHVANTDRYYGLI